MNVFDFFAMLVASLLPSPAASGVVIEVSPGSSLVAEEQVQIRVGDKFAAVVINPDTKEIYSQSEWVTVEK